jgi:proliferating cell nuclear antigen
MPEALTKDDHEALEPETDEDAAVNVLTHGDPLRSFLELPTALVDEAKARFGPDGLHIRAVDPANVGMVDVTAHATGFERYQFDGDSDRVIGLNVDRTRKVAGWARKRGGDGDPVGVDVLADPDRMRVDITRPDQELKRISEWHGIDPGSIRQEPEIPELDLPCRATPNVRGFYEAISALKDDGHDHVKVTRDGTTLVVRGHGNGVGDDEFFFPNSAWHIDDEDQAPSSLFSLDYLRDMATALKRSKADRVTLSWGQEHPMILAFEHEEWGFDGMFLLAPRIGSDD